MKYSDSAYYSGEHRLYHNNAQVMATRLEIIMHGIEKDLGEHAFDLAILEARRLEKLLSRFDHDSPVSIINRQAAKQPVITDEELFQILILCGEYYESTSGLFDIGLGRIITEIKEGSPDKQRISQSLEQAGMKNIYFDRNRRAVKFTGREVELDLGGFGKGYALESIKTILTEAGIPDTFISFGDSSVLAIGNHPHGEGWKSGISHKYKSGESLFAITLNNESLSTSGAGHIMNTKRGLVDQSDKHISVSTVNPIESEILSTAFIAANEEEKSALIERFASCRAVEISYDENREPQIRILNS